MIKNVVLIAAPGAGKGTLAKQLEELYNRVHISTGDLLREAVEKKDEVGLKVKSLLDSGQFVDDETIFAVMRKRLAEDDIANGYTFDGFPRNIKQAERYDEISKDSSIVIEKVFQLEIPEEQLISRITGRRLCSNCGKIYNIYNPELTPKVEGVCDSCGGSLYKRSDDNEETFHERFQTYIEKTQPLIDYYKEQDKLVVVDASMGSNETLKKVREIMEKTSD